MKRIVFLTLADRTGWSIDDDLAIAALAARGVAVDEIPWDRPGDWWLGYDGAVIRTPWDYQRDLPAFLAVLQAIESSSVPLANPLAIARWNGHKLYLRELAQQGIPIVPSRWGTGLDAAALRDMPGHWHATECVIKPAVGASGQDTFRIHAGLDGATLTDIARLFSQRDWIAQPFVASILTEGEYSLFYFSDRFSHAIVKQPRAGEFRVQEEHGGELTRIEATAEMQAIAAAALAVLGTPLLQARVDLIRLADGSLAVMELELIEPSLYFRMDPKAPGAFADAVVAWLA